LSDAKQRAQQRLMEGVEAAADTLLSSIKGTLHIQRGSTRTADARWLLAAVLDMDVRNEPSAQEAQPVRSVGDLARLSEHIRLLKQDERRGA
jgi:hypothetical protein